MEQPELRRRIPPDFIAQVRYLSTEEGGRRTPARSGYRPHFKLPYKEWLTSCNQEFLDKEIVNPGDTVFAEMKILWIEAFEHCLAPGDSFSLGEGHKVVAQGTVNQVMNPRLLRENASTDHADKARYLFFNDPASGTTNKEGLLSRSWKEAVLSLASAIIPKANPQFEHLYEQVRCWKIEFDLTDQQTAREIGFDDKGKAIVCAPFKKDLGLWTDHELGLEDYDRFNPTIISQAEFEEDWKKLNT